MKSANGLLQVILEYVARQDSGTEKPGVGDAFLEGLEVLFQHADIKTRKNALYIFRSLYGKAANLEYDILKNGEHALISKLCLDKCIFFDIGANVGSWTRSVVNECQNAVVHCFELIPDTAKKLSAAFKDRPNIRINPCGLYSQEGTIDTNYFEQHSELSGIYSIHDDLPARKVTCKVTTGDRYCERMGISSIRLLKADCEGAELEVLKGFSTMLRRNAIDAVQFEYGKANIVSRALLKDLHELLEGYGYRVGKLYPTGVDFKPYQLEDEDFTGPNYVACLKSRDDLIEMLSRF